ncbi:hypothetical protein LX36DRAFT_657127 [Colletotrichum falcatum]|nr:hypothetical protein LX36DRAFT_657127 [Colletotrichum falcatum]
MFASIPLPTCAIFGSSLVERLAETISRQGSNEERGQSHLHAARMHIDSVHDAVCQFAARRCGRVGEYRAGIG